MSITREATAESLLAEAGELTDRQDQLEVAMVHLQAAVSAAGGGPWEGRLDLTAEAMDDRMGDLEDRIEELKKRAARKQR